MLGNRKQKSLQQEAAGQIALADRLRRAGDLQSSEEAARDELARDPASRAAALACLGDVLNDQGRWQGAVGVYQESLSEKPDQPLIYGVLAEICLTSGNPQEALVLADRACDCAPGLTPLRLTRARVLERLGRKDEAFDELSLAFRVASRDAENIVALVEFVARHGLRGDGRDCEAAALAAFRAACMDGRRLAEAAALIVAAKYNLSSAGAGIEGETLGPLSEDELFIRLLQECVICHPAVESFCIALRRKIMSDHQGSGELPTAVARLAAAVALQNHQNGYVAWTDADEEAAVAAEDRRLGEFVRQSGSGVTAAARAALLLYAMYRPLAARNDAGRLVDLPFGGEAGRLILLTVREVREVAAEAARIETTGAMLDSQAIYPWPHITLPQPGSLMSYLRRRIAGFAPPAWSAEACDILFPNCGSGREAVGMALALPACRIRAVDPRAQALAYGARRALKLGAGNIEFCTQVAAGGHYHYIDAGRRDGGDLLASLAQLLAPGGLLRLSLTTEERAETLQSALEIGARQAHGSLQFARRDIARSGDPACEYLRQQPEFYDLGGCFTLIAEAERGGTSARELTGILAQAGLRLVAEIAPAECGGKFHLLCQSVE